MKQEAGKNKKKWLLPVIIGAVVLLIAAAVGAFLLLQPGDDGKTKDPAASTVQSDVYWNVDRYTYLDATTGLSIREPGEDGLYHIRFAVDGEQKEYLCADKKLVNRIDMLDYMGLELDSDGNIVDVLGVAQFAVVAADGFYVQKVEGDTITINSSAALNGMSTQLTVTDATGIYDVSTTDETCGKPTTPDIMDRVIVIQDNDGNTTHIFINERPVDAEVYWRVDLYWGQNDVYNSTTKTTKRIPDENGVYTLLMACNGQQVEIKCKDLEIVNKIDSAAINSQGIGLVFDDEGYAVQWTAPAKAVRGTEKCNQWDVIEINGNIVTFERKLPGSTMGATETITLAAGCHIYDTTEVSGYVGIEVDELKLGDRVYLLANADSEAVQIWITNRMVDVPMYYLLNRSFNTTTNETGLVPDEQGWYTLQVSKEGKQMTVKTKDKFLASQITKPGFYGMGLKVENGIVKKYYHYTNVTGGWINGGGSLMTSLAGPMLSTESSSGTTYNMVLSADCKIYNCDKNTATVMGEKTTLKKFDKVYPIRNAEGEIVYIYITQRYMEGTVYYNPVRKYNSVLKETTRTPDEEGWYIFENMTTGGKKGVTLKTKDKNIANIIDGDSLNIVGLQVKDGVIQKATTGAAVVKYGSAAANNCHVMNWETEGESYYYEYLASGNGGTGKMNDETKVYNVSSVYTNYIGEPTTLKVGDQIRQINGAGGYAKYIYVVARETKGSLYYLLKRYGKDENGVYKYDYLKDGKIVTLQTKDDEVNAQVGSYTVGCGIITEGTTIKRFFPAASLTDYGAMSGGNYDVVKISGNEITLKRNRPGASDDGKELVVTKAAGCKIYDVSSYGKTGKQVALKVGDRVVCYQENDSKDIKVIFVSNPNTHEGGASTVCEHCGKKVFWIPVGPHSSMSGSGHYYLTSNWNNSSILAMGSATRLGESAYDIVLDLNGKTLTSTKTRAINVLFDMKLTILDSSKAQTGTVQAAATSNGSGNVILVNYGGDCVILGGTYKLAEGTKIADYSGCIAYVGNSAASVPKEDAAGNYIKDKEGNTQYEKRVLSSASLTIKGGTFIGGNATNGGVIATGNDVTLDISNATIKPGVASGTANSIYLNSLGAVNIKNSVIGGGVSVAGGQKGKVTISGKTQIVMPEGGDYGLNIAAGKTVDFTGLTAGSKIQVMATGVFTTDYKDAATAKAAMGYFMPQSGGQQFEVVGNALSTGIKRCFYGHSEADHAAEGNTCKEPMLNWSMWTSKTAVPSTAGNYIIANDIKAAGRVVVYGDDIVVDLNGKTITNVCDKNTYNNYSLYLIDDASFKGGSTGLKGGSVTIMDNSEAQTGKIDFSMTEEYVADATRVKNWKDTDAYKKALADELYALAILDAAEVLQKDEAALLALDAAAKEAVAAQGIAPTDAGYTAAYNAALEAVAMAKLDEMAKEEARVTAIAEKYTAEVEAALLAEQTEIWNKSRHNDGIEGAFVYVRNGTLNIYGGTIDGSNINAVAATKGMINIANTNASDPDVNTVNVYGGTIIGGTRINADGTVTANGGAIMSNYANTAINVYGGTIRGTDAEVNGTDTAVKSNMGGLIYTAGTLNISGGEFIGRNTNVASIYGVKLNISGGKFYNGKSATKPCVYVSSAVNGTISGGEIEYLSVNGNGLTITGEPVIGNLYIAKGKTVAIPTLGEKADIAVTATEIFTPAYETVEAAEAVAAKLYSTDETPIAIVTNCLSVGIPEGLDNRTCIKGHTLADHEANECEYPLLQWTEWTETTKLPLTTGNYILTNDVNTNAMYMDENQHIVINLNGHNITSTNRVYMMYNTTTKATGDRSLTFCDTAETKGTISSTYTGKQDGGLFYVYYGTLNIHDVTLDASNLNVWDGDGAMTKTGAAIYVQNKDNAALNIYSGKIIGGTAGRGGVIYNNGRTVTITGTAVIEGGIGKNVAGVYFGAGNAQLIVGGNAVITANATASGTSNTLAGGYITIKDNATVSCSEATHETIGLNVLTKGLTIQDNATIKGQIKITGSAFVGPLVIKGTPNFVQVGSNPHLFYNQINNEAQRLILDVTGMTGGKIIARLPNASRTGIFGKAMAGAENLVVSGDSNYKVIVNAENQLEMIEAPAAE